MRSGAGKITVDYNRAIRQRRIWKTQFLQTGQIEDCGWSVLSGRSVGAGSVAVEFQTLFTRPLCKVRRMYRLMSTLLIAGLLLWPTFSSADNLAKEIKKAVERSTLDQPGTKPFHLVATIAPSFERDKDSGRTGTVEIWWSSPTRWKREVRSPQFHQVEMVDGLAAWQKNEGDYFPQWLEQTALELIRPIPPLEDVLLHAKDAEQRRIGPMTNLNWTTPSGTAEVHNILRSSISLQSSTGLLLYAGGLGWGGQFKDYQDFHGRMVARTVSVGSPEVTAKIMTLEEWTQIPAGFFEIAGKTGDAPLRTAVMDETSVRKNLFASGARVMAAPTGWSVRRQCYNPLCD